MSSIESEDQQQSSHLSPNRSRDHRALRMYFYRNPKDSVLLRTFVWLVNAPPSLGDLPDASRKILSCIRAFPNIWAPFCLQFGLEWLAPLLERLEPILVEVTKRISAHDALRARRGADKCKRLTRNGCIAALAQETSKPHLEFLRLELQLFCAHVAVVFSRTSVGEYERYGDREEWKLLHILPSRAFRALRLLPKEETWCHDVLKDLPSDLPPASFAERIRFSVPASLPDAAKDRLDEFAIFVRQAHGFSQRHKRTGGRRLFVKEVPPSVDAGNETVNSGSGGNQIGPVVGASAPMPFDRKPDGRISRLNAVARIWRSDVGDPDDSDTDYGEVTTFEPNYSTPVDESLMLSFPGSPPNEWRSPEEINELLSYDECPDEDEETELNIWDPKSEEFLQSPWSYQASLLAIRNQLLKEAKMLPVDNRILSPVELVEVDISSRRILNKLLSRSS